MVTILLSDTHFGVRQNSITWLNYQMKFFYEQLIPWIRSSKELVRLLHLGDVFDSRSSINPVVANRVKYLFEELCKQCIGGVYIIGGNHDYYSPNESSSNDNSVDLVLGELCYYCPNIHLITKDFYKEGNELFVPWFRYFDFEKLKEQLHDVDKVYVHNDLVMIDSQYQQLFKNKQVYSGHIHTPCHRDNLHTLGSTFALTFTDCNADRGFYVMSDDQLEFVPNQYSIRFWRFYNEEILKEHSIKDVDYVELYVDQENLIKPEYSEAIKHLSKRVNNVVVIPRSEEVVNESSTDFTKYDIKDICKRLIPDDLKPKFELISRDEE